jgi:hypothetical protein
MARLAAAALLAASPLVLVRAADGPPAAEPGVWWDVTMEMSIRGAGADPQAETHTERECLPKKIPDHPPPQSGDCTWSDFRRDGPRVSFKLKCPEGVTGEADLRWTADTYSGTTVLRGHGVENRIAVKGKKVGGDCDASAREEREPSDEGDPGARAERCADAGYEGELERFLPPEDGAAAECADPAPFCAVLDTRRVLARLRVSGLEGARPQAGKLCGIDVAAVEQRHCAELATASQGKKRPPLDDETAEFLFGACPELARSLARRECAARPREAMPDAQREFCTRWAQEAPQKR